MKPGTSTNSDSQPNLPRRSIDVGKALKLRLKGCSYAEIGRLLGGEAKPFAESSVYEALESFTELLKNPEAIKTYRENEADLLDAVRMELITSIPKDLARKGKQALSGYQKVGMYGILFDKTRLMRGQSTENIHNLTSIIEAVHGKRDLPADDPVIEAETVDK